MQSLAKLGYDISNFVYPILKSVFPIYTTVMHWWIFVFIITFFVTVFVLVPWSRIDNLIARVIVTCGTGALGLWLLREFVTRYGTFTDLADYIMYKGIGASFVALGENFPILIVLAILFPTLFVLVGGLLMAIAMIFKMPAYYLALTVQGNIGYVIFRILQLETEGGVVLYFWWGAWYAAVGTVKPPVDTLTQVGIWFLLSIIIFFVFSLNILDVLSGGQALAEH